MRTILRLLPLVLLPGTLPAGTVIDVTSAPYLAKPGSEEDATPAFQKALQAAKAASAEGRGPVTLRIPPGRYDFFPGHATRRPCHCSNATEPDSDGTRTIALDLTDTAGLTLDGPGARLVMRGKMTLLVAERCRRLTLKGLEFDFARPAFSEITALEKHPGHWIGKAHPDSRYTIVDGKNILWTGEDWQDTHNMVQHFDPESGKAWRGRDPLTGVTSITDLGNRKLRFEGGALAQVAPGRTYQFRNTRRDQVAMWFNHCKDVLLEDVAVRACHGFGIDSQFTENITFRRLRFAPDPESGRTNASAADLLHFSGCKGAVRILDSTLAGGHDDAVNVHGTHLRVIGQPAPDQICLRFMHPQTWGFQAFFPGDEIELVNKDTLLPYAKATVKAVAFSPSSPREQTLTLNQKVTVAALNSDAVENVTWTPSVEIRGCTIQHIPHPRHPPQHPPPHPHPGQPLPPHHHGRHPRLPRRLRLV